MPQGLRDKLLKEPELNSSNVIYLQAWQDLTTTRPIGFGIGSIPWAQCHLWASSRGYDLATEEDIWEVVRRVDIKMIEHWRARAEDKSRQSRAKNAAPR